MWLTSFFGREGHYEMGKPRFQHVVSGENTFRPVDYGGNRQESLSEPNTLIISPIKLDLLISICCFFSSLKPKYDSNKTKRNWGFCLNHYADYHSHQLDLFSLISICYFFFPSLKPRYNINMLQNIDVCLNIITNPIKLDSFYHYMLFLYLF